MCVLLFVTPHRHIGLPPFIHLLFFPFRCTLSLHSSPPSLVNTSLITSPAHYIPHLHFSSTLSYLPLTLTLFLTAIHFNSSPLIDTSIPHISFFIPHLHFSHTLQSSPLILQSSSPPLTHTSFLTSYTNFISHLHTLQLISPSDFIPHLYLAYTLHYSSLVLSPRVPFSLTSLTYQWFTSLYSPSVLYFPVTLHFLSLSSILHYTFQSLYSFLSSRPISLHFTNTSQCFPCITRFVLSFPSHTNHDSSPQIPQTHFSPLTRTLLMSPLSLLHKHFNAPSQVPFFIFSPHTLTPHSSHPFAILTTSSL